MDIAPGMVFYLPFTNLFGQSGTPSPKYAIVARIEPELLFLMICTELPAFVRNNEKLERSYIRIDVATHPFLVYDSWVDCTDAKGEYSLERLKAAHSANPDCYMGELTDTLLRQVLGGVDRSLRLERKKKSSISSALNGEVNARAQRLASSAKEDSGQGSEK